MKLGIFAKTFRGDSPLEVLRAARAAGYVAVQYNMSCSGLGALPAEIRRRGRRQGPVCCGPGRRGDRGGLGDLQHDPPRPGRAASGAGTASWPSPAPPGSWEQGSSPSAPGAGTPRTRGGATPTTRAPRRSGTSSRNASSWSPWPKPAISSSGSSRSSPTWSIRLGGRASSWTWWAAHGSGSCSIRRISSRWRVRTSGGRSSKGPSIYSAIASRSPTPRTGGTDGSFVAAGKGVIDFVHYVKCLRRAGFDGTLVAHGLSADEATGVASYLRDALSVREEGR